MKKENIAGVDYGSKLAGTTVISFVQAGSIHFLKSDKNKDADQFLLQTIQNLNIGLLFLDAPLSLPGVYTNPSAYQDYFYRHADKEVKGMSPMFLGGLTARAIKLKAMLEQTGVKVREIYPSKLAELYGLKDINYKKTKVDLIPNIKRIKSIHQDLHFQEQAIETWHHFDALLAFLSGYRFLQGTHNTYGSEQEGVIIV